jgi:hypothetical protein
MPLATVGGLMPASLAHLIGHSPLLREIRPIILVTALLLFANAVCDRRLSWTHPPGIVATGYNFSLRLLRALIQALFPAPPRVRVG